MANEKTPQQIATDTLPSTVLLEMEDSNGQPHGVGSGFLIEGGEIVTNLHVVEKAYKGSAKLFNLTERYEIAGYTALDVNNDLIILRIKNHQDQTIVEKVPLRLGDSDVVRQGETIYAVGNPEGLEGTISDGIISGIRMLNTGHKRIQITAPISPGSSGGPVLNTNGEVIGVSVQALPSLQPIPSSESQETQYINRAQNLNLAIPSNSLKLLLKQQRDKIISLWEAKLERVDYIKKLGWIGSASYTFPLQNLSSKYVRNVHCLIIFKDEKNTEIARDNFIFPGLIPANSSKVVIRLSDSDTTSLINPSLIPLFQQLDSNFNASDINDSPIESFLIGLADLLLTNIGSTDYSHLAPYVKRLTYDYDVHIIGLEIVD